MADRNRELSDELLERARGGDEGAFSELVRNHQHEVFTLALRLLGNYELAADASQETFIRAWRALPRFRGDSALSTWLHRITVNTSWTLGSDTPPPRSTKRSITTRTPRRGRSLQPRPPSSAAVSGRRCRSFPIHSGPSWFSRTCTAGLMLR